MQVWNYRFNGGIMLLWWSVHPSNIYLHNIKYKIICWILKIIVFFPYVYLILTFNLNIYFFDLKIRLCKKIIKNDVVCFVSFQEQEK